MNEHYKLIFTHYLYIVRGYFVPLISKYIVVIA